MERLVLWHRVIPVGPGGSDDAEAAATRLAWTRRVAARLRAAGATVLGTCGGAVAAVFEPPDLVDALDVALALLDEADRDEGGRPPMRVTIGAALGVVDNAATEGELPLWTGAAIDRAQLIANRARRGELALDAQARNLSAYTFLFGRHVTTGVSSLRGHVIDRRQPRRDACRLMIGALHPAPAMPASTEAALAPLRAAAQAKEGTHRFVLRGPPGAGAEAALQAMEGALTPPLVLRLGPVPATLEPLGSLRLGLLHRWGSAEAVAHRGGAVLGAVARGQSAKVDAVVEALGALLRGTAGTGRPWIVLEEVDGIDPATVDVIGEAARDPDTGVLLLSTLSMEARLPKALGQGSHEEIVLPALRNADARAVAAAVLGSAEDDDVTRRVAVLGGDTPLGLEEAARTLVAAGDLVQDGGRFVWRATPRRGVSAIPTESLIEERLAALEPAPHRLLEVICVLPHHVPEGWTRTLATVDGVSPAQQEALFGRLRAEMLLAPEPPLSPSSALLRSVVMRSMPPSRAAELHRFAAEALEASLDPEATFARATLGYYQAEGGAENEGAETLLSAASAARESGYGRSAIRLAAAAVQYDPSDATREDAAQLTRKTVPPPSAKEGRMTAGASSEEVADVFQRALEALRARDFETLDRCVDTAIAEGRDPATAARVRAIAHLMRGDTKGAMRALARARAVQGKDRRRAARQALALALVMLHAGDPSRALRATLEALAHARTLRDPRGEAAALHALGACFRALGREGDAQAVDEASPA